MDYFVISKGWTGLANEIKDIMKSNNLEVIVDRRTDEIPVKIDRRKTVSKKIASS